MADLTLIIYCNNKTARNVLSLKNTKEEPDLMFQDLHVQMKCLFENKSDVLQIFLFVIGEQATSDNEKVMC